MLSKAILHSHCLTLLQDKISRLQEMINDAQQAASDDTKSSAGDKFETGREMMKREIDKYNLQLAEAEKQHRFLKQLTPAKTSDTIGPGSLVETPEGVYYFSVPLGKLTVEGESCFALSLVAPIGKALKGRKEGETISFMGRQILIKALY
ncbi:MAG: 3-oxoacyl-ACP synthase [Bacteroidota bacterium]